MKVLLPIKEQFQFSYVARLETEVGVLFGDDMVDVLLRHHGVLEEVIGRADRLKVYKFTFIYHLGNFISISYLNSTTCF